MKKLKAAERFENLKQAKFRLDNARANFERSMEKLNKELVIMKTEY